MRTFKSEGVASQFSVKPNYQFFGDPRPSNKMRLLIRLTISRAGGAATRRKEERGGTRQKSNIPKQMVREKKNRVYAHYHFQHWFEYLLCNLGNPCSTARLTCSRKTFWLKCFQEPSGNQSFIAFCIQAWSHGSCNRACSSEWVCRQS